MPLLPNITIKNDFNLLCVLFMYVYSLSVSCLCIIYSPIKSYWHFNMFLGVFSHKTNIVIAFWYFLVLSQKAVSEDSESANPMYNLISHLYTLVFLKIKLHTTVLIMKICFFFFFFTKGQYKITLKMFYKTCNYLLWIKSDYIC